MACRYTYQGKTYEAHEFDDILRAMKPEIASQYMPSVRSTPTAPFVTSTDKWLSLALKRIIKLAVDEGYDKVAFINGEQSADRYDLSKQVKEITVGVRGSERFVSIDAEQGEIADLTVDAGGIVTKGSGEFDGKPLADVIGKDLADKIMSNPEPMRLRGIDLKVGGEGMKAFYDKIVPSAAKDVIRKLGGGQIEKADIGHGDQTAFTITDKMREQAADGLPMFKKQASTGMSVEAAQAIVDKLSDKIDVTVVATPADLPVPAPSDAKGLYHNGKAWIVASNNANAREVAETYAHEVIGHYGLRNMLGREAFAKTMGLIQLALKSGNKPLNAIRDQIRKTYVDENGKFNLTPNQEADEIAAAVAQGAIDENGNMKAGFGFMKAVYAKIAQFLRDMGITIKFTNTELQGLLTESLRQLGVGEKTNGGNVTVLSRKFIQTNTEAFKKLSVLLGSADSARDMLSIANKSAIDGLERDSKAIANLLKSASTFSHSNSNIRIPSSVIPHVLNMSNNHQIFRAIVRSIPVDVMNLLGREKISAENLLRDKTMLENMLPIKAASNISFTINVPDSLALLGSIANTAAKVASLARAAVENNSALSAGKVNSVFSTHGGSVTETDSFSKWFGDSKVVDADGKPLVVYHGTDKDITEFSDTSAGKNTVNFGMFGLGAGYFSKSPSEASSYANGNPSRTIYAKDQVPPTFIDTPSGKIKAGANVMPVYLSMQNPYMATSREDLGAKFGLAKDWYMSKEGSATVTARLKELGFDGVIVDNGAEYVPFNPTQIKSATGNNGDFSPTNPDIRYSRDLLTPYTESEARAKQEREEQARKDEQRTPSKPAKKVTAEQTDMFDYQGGLFSRAQSNATALSSVTDALKAITTPLGSVSLWNKTIGTKYHLKTKDADFARVFDGYNRQVDDTAHYAIEAESNAPSILMRLESLGDIWGGLVNSGAKQKADLNAVSKALFANIEGQSGVKQKLFNDEELKQEYQLTPRQIEMYHQARKSVDTSIERLAQTYAAQLGESVGMPIDMAKDFSLDDTVTLVKTFTKGQPNQAEIDARLDGLAKHAKFLQKTGYMPALRFGEFAITVTNPDGTTESFQMFESKTKAKLAKMQLDKKYPNAKVELSVMNPEQYAMFKGVSPETVEMFAQFTGMDKNEAAQAILLWQSQQGQCA